MTKIKYTLPQEFLKVIYVSDLQVFSKKYVNMFDENLKELIINVEIHIGPTSEQLVNTFELENGKGLLTIPFKRYVLIKEITELPSVKEFYSTLEFAINKIVRDYKEQ